MTSMSVTITKIKCGMKWNERTMEAFRTVKLQEDRIEIPKEKKMLE